MAREAMACGPNQDRSTVRPSETGSTRVRIPPDGRNTEEPVLANTAHDRPSGTWQATRGGSRGPALTERGHRRRDSRWPSPRVVQGTEGDGQAVLASVWPTGEGASPGEDRGDTSKREQRREYPCRERLPASIYG